MRCVLAVVLVCWCAVACDTKGELREWRPEDHGQPAATEVDPSRVPEGAQAAEPSRTGDPVARAAEALWQVSCAGCHGIDGRGRGAQLPSGASVPDMTDGVWQKEHTDSEIAMTIAEGRGMMPAFGDQVNPRGIAALTMHIRKLAASTGEQARAQGE